MLWPRDVMLRQGRRQRMLNAGAEGEREVVCGQVW